MPTYKILFQTSAMCCPASWEAQGNWKGSTELLDYALYAMLQFSTEFAKNWASQSVVDLNVYVVDDKGNKVASVHFDNPSKVKKVTSEDEAMYRRVFSDGGLKGEALERRVRERLE